MTNTVTPLVRPSRHSLQWRLGAVILGTLFLTAASYIEVPMVPVPINMQTFAVAMVGALYGWRLGTITVIVWLGQAVAGLPVLSGGASGAQHFIGPTAGYLFAFPLAAALTGWLTERGWNQKRPVLAFVSMLSSNAICLIFGATWLATMIGPEQAIVHGITPFLIGAVLKSALGASFLTLIQHKITGSVG